MKLSWRTEWPHALVLVAMFGVAIASWGSTPDRIPVHWGWSGQPGRWGGRFEGLLLLPLVALALYLLMVLLPRIDPGRSNYGAFAGPYATIRLALLVLLAGAAGLIQLELRGHRTHPMVTLPLLLGLFFIAIGSVIGKLEPNWFVGVRTPWTLSSRRSWEASNRLAGRVMVVEAVLLFVAAAFHRPWALVAAIACFLLGMIATVVYSYRVWRDDPARVPPAAS